MKVKCLIIDDEPLAIRVIRNHAEKVPWMEIIGSTTNPLEGMELVKKLTVDVLVLDLQMPELNGLEFMASLKNPPVVIFTTAFRQFAADAFELDGLDYLVKPIAFPRFLKAVNKYVERHIQHTDLQTLGTTRQKDERFFFIRQQHEMTRINIRDILYIEGMKDYVQIHLADKRHIYKARLSNLEEELKDDQFIRIHKSFLVPIDKISKVIGLSLQIDGRELPIGRTYKDLVYKTLGL